MAYHIIRKQPVFLSCNRFKELKRLVSNDKTPEWRILCMIDGSKENKELYELMYKQLQKIQAEDSEKFRSYWIYFDLKDEEAVINTWDLLYDYCHYYGHAYLSDLRDFSEKIIDDYQGESYTYPMGKIFTLNHKVKPKKWWWRVSHRMKDRTIRIVINVEKVYCIKGNLKQFEIYLDNIKIICGEHIDIF